MPACSDGPFVDNDLVWPDASCAPFGAWRAGLHHLHIKIKHLFIGGHGVFHAHDELHIELSIERALFMHTDGSEDVREVERLDLWRDLVFDHLGGEPCDKIGAVLIDPRWEVVGPHGERGHIGA